MRRGKCGTLFSRSCVERATAVSGAPTVALNTRTSCACCRRSARCASASRKGCSSGCSSARLAAGATAAAPLCAGAGFVGFAGFAASIRSSCAMRAACAPTASVSCCTCDMSRSSAPAAGLAQTSAAAGLSLAVSFFGLLPHASAWAVRRSSAVSVGVRRMVSVSERGVVAPKRAVTARALDSMRDATRDGDAP